MIQCCQDLEDFDTNPGGPAQTSVLQKARAPRISSAKGKVTNDKETGSDIGDIDDTVLNSGGGMPAPPPPVPLVLGDALMAAPSNASEAELSILSEASSGRRQNVPRGSRQIRWGKAAWTIAETVDGLGADCRCHQDTIPVGTKAPTKLHCKKARVDHSF